MPAPDAGGRLAVSARAHGAADGLRRAELRRWTVVVLGAAGLAAYNWWLPAVVLRRPAGGLDVLISDLSADGQSHARAFQHIDLAGGALLLVALVLRRVPRAPKPARQLQQCLLAFALFAAVGGVFPYACAPTFDGACRRAEAHLRLPLHHYLHMLVGILEFASATAAILVATRLPSTTGSIARGLRAVLAVAYPAIAVCFFTRRLGVLAEGAFFLAFSTITALALWMPAPLEPG